GGRARGRADGDALRPEPAGPLAHEARGHEARASRALGRRPRPPGVEDPRPPPSPSRRRLTPFVWHPVPEQPCQLRDKSSPTTGLRSTPMPSISTSTTSPARIVTGGVRA